MPQVNADTCDQRPGRRQPFTPWPLRTTASRQVYKRVVETTPETTASRWLREPSEACTDEAPSRAFLGRVSDYCRARSLSGQHEHKYLSKIVSAHGSTGTPSEAFRVLRSLSLQRTISAIFALKYNKMKFLGFLGCALATFTAVQASDIPLPEALQMVYGLPECSVS